MLIIRIIFWAAVAAVLGYALIGDVARQRLATARAARELRKAGVSRRDARAASAIAVALSAAGRPAVLVADASKFTRGMAEAAWSGLASDEEPIGEDGGPDPVSADVPLNPECREGKHGNCRLDAWDFVEDLPVRCGCQCHREGVRS